MDALGKPGKVILRQAFRRDEVRELEGGDQSDTKADLAGTGRKIIVTARNQRVTSTVELKWTLSRVMYGQVVLRNVPSNAEARSTGHRLRQPREVRPHVRIEFADNKVSPVTPGPFWRRFIERRSTLTTPRAEEWLLFGDAKRRFKKIGVENIVVVHENKNLSLRLKNPTAPGRGQAELPLANQAGLRMPRKISRRSLCRRAGIINNYQFPLLSWKRLVLEPVEAS